MAIKGKGRTRPRPPARAPRRAPVAPPTPFLRRRWVQLVVAFLLGLGLAWFLVWVTNGIRSSREASRHSEEQVEQRRALGAYKALVDAEVGKVGTLGPPGLPPTLAPELTSALDAIASGEATAETARTLAELADRLEASAEAIADHGLADAIRDKGLSLGEANAITNSQERLAAALRGYAEAARLAALAARGSGEAEALLRRAKAIEELARDALADGWNEYGLGLAAAGLAPGAAETPGAGVPGLP